MRVYENYIHTSIEEIPVYGAERIIQKCFMVTNRYRIVVIARVFHGLCKKNKKQKKSNVYYISIDIIVLTSARTNKQSNNNQNMFIGIQFDADEFADVRQFGVQLASGIPGLEADTQPVGKGILVGIRRPTGEDGKQRVAVVDQFREIRPFGSGNYHYSSILIRSVAVYTDAHVHLSEYLQRRRYFLCYFFSIGRRTFDPVEHSPRQGQFVLVLLGTGVLRGRSYERTGL